MCRYDIDGSGTINSGDELEQLVTNMLYKMGTGADESRFITAKMKEVLDQIGDSINWEEAQFVEWYLKIEAEAKEALGT